MTMLDRMRRHKGWLKWSLALVCLAFVIFYIPDFLQSPTIGPAANDVVAEVDGREVTAGEFLRLYRAQLNAYQMAYGGQMDVELLKQLGVHEQILQRVIEEHAALAEAERLGLTVTDAEIRERILALPGFQENGQFIGEARYRQLLRMQNPPMTTADFEESMRHDLLIEKLRGAITDWVTVSDAEVEEEYRRRNERVKLELVALTPDRFRDQVTVSDAEIAGHFEKNQETYRVPAKRKVKYLLVDMQKLRESVDVPPAEVERIYNEQRDQYTTPEQVRASHILFRTEGKDQAEVRELAEEVLAKARAGADFAELATQYSEDEATKPQGGDLGQFDRGKMVPAFEQAAFTQEVGAVGDLVQTEYGFHIIKVTEKQAGGTRTLDEVGPQIVEQIKWERAQEQATELGDTLAAAIRTADDLDRVAKEHGLQVQESGFFSASEPIAGLGFSPEASQQAFQMEQGGVAGPIRTPQGPAFITVTATQDSYLPKVEEVRDEVREDLTVQKAAELAKAKANELASSLKGAENFVEAAKEAGFEARATDSLTRGMPLPEVGTSQEVEKAAFSLPVGGVSDPIAVNNSTVILRVAERQEIDVKGLAEGRDALRAELRQMQQGRFFDAYMNKAKERMRIEIDQQTLQRIVA